MCNNTTHTQVRRLEMVCSRNGVQTDTRSLTELADMVSDVFLFARTNLYVARLSDLADGLLGTTRHDIVDSTRVIPVFSLSLSLSRSLSRSVALSLFFSLFPLSHAHQPVRARNILARALGLPTTRAQANGDIRSCIYTLQFASAKSKKFNQETLTTTLGESTSGRMSLPFNARVKRPN
jgi:hypothetical protein